MIKIIIRGKKYQNLKGVKNIKIQKIKQLEEEKIIKNGYLLSQNEVKEK